MESHDEQKQDVKANERKYSLWKRVVRFFVVWDGLWSFPLAIAGFLVFGWLGHQVFGESFGEYDPSIFQAAIYTAGIMVFINLMTFLGVYFNFREIWRFYYCESAEAYRNLSGWAKIVIFLVMYIFLVITFVIIFKSLI